MSNCLFATQYTHFNVMFLDYMCHVYVRSDGLGGVVISDAEYPNRVAHTLINKVLKRSV